jgi:hypothetical protein
MVVPGGLPGGNSPVSWTQAAVCRLMLGPASSGGVDIADLGSFPSAMATATGLSSGGGVGRLGALRAISGAGFMLAPKGHLQNKTRASWAWCIGRSAHQGPSLVHIATRTGYPGGGVHPMGLCRESAEDVEQSNRVSGCWRPTTTLWSD